MLGKKYIFNKKRHIGEVRNLRHIDDVWFIEAVVEAMVRGGSMFSGIVKKMKLNLTIITVLRVACGLIFLYAGLIKLFDLHSFRDYIELYKLVSGRFIGIVTISIPSFEFICGLFLILGIFKRASLIFLTILIAIFIIAIDINLYRDRSFDCGCFGVLTIFGEISWNNVVFDYSLMLIMMFLYFKSSAKINIIQEFKVLISAIGFVALIAVVPYSNQTLYYSLNLEKIKNIDWKDANEMLKNKETILIDARSSDKYKRLHIKNAVSIPEEDFSEYYQYHKDIDKKSALLIYCDSEDCNASKKLAYRLLKKGYLNINVIRSGISGFLKLRMELSNKGITE